MRIAHWVSLLLASRWLSVRFSLWSAQGNAALWLQQIYVIIFEVDIVVEQKQTYIGHNLFVFMIIHCPNFLLLPTLHRCTGIPVNQLPGFVLKNSFGMILEVLFTKQ